jgi:hypothetical protein
MGDNMKNILRLTAWSVMLVGAFRVSASAPVEAPAANVTERWSSQADWQLSAVESQVGGAWSSNDAAIRIACPKLNNYDRIEYSYVTLLAASNASAGLYIGDYGDKLIDAIEFEVKSTSFAGQVQLILASGSNVEWKTIVGIPSDTAGKWVKVSVPLVYSSSWWVMNAPRTAESFLDAKRAVTSVAVRAFRAASDEQTLLVDNFKLIGPWGGPFPDGVSVAWRMENNLLEGQSIKPTEDKDGDGLSNEGEYLAGTDPNDPLSTFRLEIARGENGGTVVKWNESKYRYFELLQASNLDASSNFSRVVLNQGVGLQRVVEVDPGQGSSGPRFYKVRISESNPDLQ